LELLEQVFLLFRIILLQIPSENLSTLCLSALENFTVLSWRSEPEIQKQMYGPVVRRSKWGTQNNNEIQKRAFIGEWEFTSR